ncbi:hypothetical protein [Chryseobacterium vrystaatense]|uniref:Uncharacterized protein n=1 Tax=Chryseobacterium vrystaatense TaxID=307480 RepID=A0ABR4USQ9_9FLAO|nr:hypothetical protein [Chryseobacterium vrystaatense]KFF28165.1 hypothetical protein IW16_02810 [Chryseobacterium vrystaatense]
MKSIAIWESRNDNNPFQDIELHFNYWKIPNKRKEFHRFLDIGLKLISTQNTNCINFYFPAKIEQDNFHEIVSKFINKPDLLSAIFNENYKVVSQVSKQHKILNDQDEEVFTIYEFSSNDLTFEYKYNGTIVSINLPKLNKQLYIRFRISGQFLNQLSTISTPPNSVFESAFSELEMIDFRVNEIRDLSKDLVEIYGKMCHIKKQHFFYICSNNEDVIGYHTPYLSCRNLENYRWNGYVDLPNIESAIFLAYHWKWDSQENSSLLIKSKYEKNNWNTIAKYLLLVVGISLLGSCLYDIFKLIIKLFITELK